MRAVIEFKDCRDCPYRRSQRNHGECWEECSHPALAGKWDVILWGCQTQFEAIPEWCPLMENKNDA